MYRQGAIYKGGERREGPPSKRNDLKNKARDTYIHTHIGKVSAYIHVVPPSEEEKKKKVEEK